MFGSPPPLHHLVYTEVQGVGEGAAWSILAFIKKKLLSKVKLNLNSLHNITNWKRAASNCQKSYHLAVHQTTQKGIGKGRDETGWIQRQRFIVKPRGYLTYKRHLTW